jgi:hypothetical protein
MITEMSKCCTNLKGLELATCELDDKCLIALIRSNPGLKSFSLRGGEASSRIVLELARNCTGLSELAVNYMDLSLDLLIYLLRQCGELSSLSITGCGFNNNSIADVTQHLSEVSNDNSSLHPPTARAPVHQNMRTLRLDNFELFTDELDALLRACPCLTALEVWGCEQLEDLDAVPFGTYCPCLQRLSVLGNASVPGSAMLLDVSQHCSGLRSLEIHFSDNLTTTGLGAVARQCPLLEEANFHGCRDVTHHGLLALAKHSRSLKSLILTDCADLSEEALRTVMQSCDQLVELSVVGCTGLTAKLMRMIEERYPSENDESWRY